MLELFFFFFLGLAVMVEKYKEHVSLVEVSIKLQCARLFLSSNELLSSSSCQLCKGTINHRAMICSTAITTKAQHFDEEMCGTVDIRNAIPSFSLIHSSQCALGSSKYDVLSIPVMFELP